VLIRRAEVEGRAPVDVRIDADRIVGMAHRLGRRAGEEEIDAAGGTLLPGLHDHHLHLLALAAAGSSLRCGPPEVVDAAGLAAALAAARPLGGWIRGVGYHESVAGALDAARLEGLAPGRLVRVQHRSGAAWIVSRAGVAALGLDGGVDAPGVERDARGRATGRLFGLDAWLRERLPAAAGPDLASVGRSLARCGVTGVTDATPSNAAPELEVLESAARRGDLPQRLCVMGGTALPEPRHPRVERGSLKLMLREADLPDFDAVREQIEAAHAAGRSVALHCVTRAEVLLATALLAAAGCRRGDRLEHASVAPPESVERMAALPLTVVTQPGFLRERGDVYAEDVEPGDRAWLYRGRGFLEAGVPLGAGTDAPFGEADPWRAMEAAVERRSAGGRELGPRERLTPEQALALFTAPASAPGGAPRRVAVGAVADLCLLSRPWREARRVLSSACVAATLIAGRVCWRAGQAGLALR
jgi:predicted amidohydrolase YtcJ